MFRWTRNIQTYETYGEIYDKFCYTKEEQFKQL